MNLLTPKTSLVGTGPQLNPWRNNESKLGKSLNFHCPSSLVVSADPVPSPLPLPVYWGLPPPPCPLAGSPEEGDRRGSQRQTSLPSRASRMRGPAWNQLVSAGVQVCNHGFRIMSSGSQKSNFPGSPFPETCLLFCQQFVPQLSEESNQAEFTFVKEFLAV